MELEKLLLTKDEIPILYDTLFVIPIHPKLLSNDIKIDERIANNVFPEAAKDWYEDLQKYVKTSDDTTTNKWVNRIFLNKKPSIKEDYDHQIVDPPGYWRDWVFTRENGFASTLSIDRNAGGSLNIGSDNPVHIHPYEVKFTQEKFLEFRFNKNEYYVYHHHNVDYYPGALFLRNWAILYMNEVFKQVFE